MSRILKATLFILLAAAALLMVIPTSVHAKTKVKIKKVFRSDTYQFAEARTIVIYTVCPVAEKPRSSLDGWRWRPGIELPSDSMRLELAREIGKSIARRDSTVKTIVVLSADSSVSDSGVIAVARDSLGADAVFMAQALEARTENSSPNMQGLTGNTIELFARGHSANARAKIRFALHDADDATLIWTATCEAKVEAKGGDMFDFNTYPPPPIEDAVGAAFTAAMSKLPF